MLNLLWERKWAVIGYAKLRSCRVIIIAKSKSPSSCSRSHYPRIKLLVARSLEKDAFASNTVWLHFWCLTANSFQALALPGSLSAPHVGKLVRKPRAPSFGTSRNFKTRKHGQAGKEDLSQVHFLCKIKPRQSFPCPLTTLSTYFKACLMSRTKIDHVSRSLFILSWGACGLIFDTWTKFGVGSIPPL